LAEFYIIGSGMVYFVYQNGKVRNFTNQVSKLVGKLGFFIIGFFN